MDEIASRIRERRLDLRLSYQDLALRTGLSKSTLQRYETGSIRNIPLGKLNALAEGLNVEKEWILGMNEMAGAKAETGATHLGYEASTSSSNWRELDFLTPKQVAEILQVSRDTAMNVIHSMPHVRIGRIIRVPTEAFLKYLKGARG